MNPEGQLKEMIRSKVKPGDLYGKLTANSRVGVDSKRNAMWLCMCQCGSQSVVRASQLTRGQITSCGCSRSKPHSHGATCKGQNQKLYAVWVSMRSRCHPTKGHPRYGLRGIRVCEEWATFPLFSAWALRFGYADGLTIERIDNDGPYEAGNCKWIPRGRQSLNTRRTLKWTAFGKTQTVTEWIEELGTGICYDTIMDRLQSGIPPEIALTAPNRRGGSFAEARK